MNLIPFNFEGRDVRAVDVGGVPHLVGKDVAEALGYTNPNKAMGDHCKGVTKRYPLSTAGGVQLVRVLGEADVMRLVVSSSLPEAQRFERFLFEELLPEYRRTGGFRAAAAEPVRQISHAEEQTAALLLIGKTIAELPGVKPGIAMASTLEAIQLTTGVNVAPFRKALPPAEEAPELTPTLIGEQCGLTAQKVNARLCALGLQDKQPTGAKVPYVLTEAGKAHGELLPFKRGSHAGYSILWKRSVLPLLSTQEAA